MPERTPEPGPEPLREAAMALLDSTALTDPEEAWYSDPMFWRAFIDEDDARVFDEHDVAFLTVASPYNVLALAAARPSPAEPPVADLRAAVKAFLGVSYPNNGEGRTDRLTWTVPERAFGDLRRALEAPALVASSPEPLRGALTDIIGLLDGEQHPGESTVNYHYRREATAIAKSALKAETPGPHLGAAIGAAFDRAVLSGWMDIYDAGTVRRIREVVLLAARLTSDTQPPAEPGEVER